MSKTLEELPIQRLSPKHQVTLLKGARGLDGVEGLSHICAFPHGMTGVDGQRYPVIVLMTEDELEKRENRIRQREDLSAVQQEHQIALLNGLMRQLSIDGQRRIVLPPHFVRHLGVDRSVFMFTSNVSVLVWNPEHWLAYCGEAGAGAPEQPLMI